MDYSCFFVFLQGQKISCHERRNVGDKAKGTITTTPVIIN